MANDPLNQMDDALQREIESALGDMSIEDMLDYADKPKARGARDFRTGTVVGIHGDDVFVEFGPKSQGICPISQFDEKPETGVQMDFVVVRFDKAEGILVLSREGAIQKAQWESLELGQVIEARCTGTNKGGLELEVSKHKAFMPAGQVDLRHVPDLAVFIGEKMPCEIIELDRARGRIVLSRKSFMEAERAVQREDILDKLVEGETMAATITSLQSFGAFADLGGIDGLIHISDLSWKRVNNPAEVVKLGDQVNVKILKVDRSGDSPKIGLGLKQTLEDPYASETEALEVGGTATGRVTKLMDFGAFVELAPGVEGLIHISELAHERVNRVSNVVKQDEVVTVKILSIDPGSRRIGLSLKAMVATPETGGEFDRGDDATMDRLRAQLGSKWGDDLKGGLS